MCCICQCNNNGVKYGFYLSEEEGCYRRKFCDDCGLFACTAKELKLTRLNKNSLITPQEQANNFWDYLSKDPKERLVQNINYLLMMFDQDPQRLIYTAVELKIAMERFGIKDVCHIAIDVDCDYKLRLHYTGKDEENE